jgi:arylsulfatase A-like enzyme
MTMELAGAPAIVLAIGVAVAVADPGADRKPNVLILLGDDCTWSLIGCYGGQAQTPNIDRMADEGMRFDQAIGTTAMCTPTRHSLYTGIYPIRRGGYQNHSAVKPGTKSICHHLGALGYRVGLAGKRHIRPDDSFPFEKVPGFPGNCVLQKTPRHELGGVREFMTRKSDQPFCLIIASVHPHGPWTEGDRSLYPKDSLRLPPHWVDTPETRIAYRNYLAEVTELDHQVGDMLQLLRDENLEENTLFIFASEQGGQFPGEKWTLWDAGVKFAMIARWPDKIKSHVRTQALVQYEDVLPTLVDLAGGERIPDIDGRSFLPVLFGKADRHREYAFGVHSNVPEGPPYPIRSIRSTKYKLILNLLPEATYKEKHLTEQDNYNYWKSWVARAETDPHAAWAVKRYQRRPSTEFYDVKSDPFELRNLAERPEYADQIQTMREELEGWMKSQGDTGAATDQEP